VVAAWIFSEENYTLTFMTGGSFATWRGNTQVYVFDLHKESEREENCTPD
jgi:hypothetical protein